MNKKQLILILLFIGAFISVIIGLFAMNQNVHFILTEEGNIGVSISVNSYEEIIKPYYSAGDNTHYFFMPSTICENKIDNHLDNVDLFINAEKLNRHAKFEWSDGTLYQIAYGDVDIAAKFISSSDIATLFITTESGGMKRLNSGKTVSESGRMDVIEADGTVSYSGGIFLKGRGNSTYHHFSKKPFNIKLNHAAGILGMDMDKDFCLLANSWDYSYMNNKLAFDMAANAGFRYVPEAEYADVYFNGDYWGIYLVTEKVELDQNRIDITDLEVKNEAANPGINMSTLSTFDYWNKRGVYLGNNPSDITGGYLLEIDYRLKPSYPNRVFTTSYFETDDHKTSINIKSPEYASLEEVNYISSLTNELEQAIMSDDGYSVSGKYYLDYIDLDSWVNWYMIAEIAYDLDKDGTNTYLYKDEDSVDAKFYMGPVWDYDCRFGGTDTYSYPDLLTRLNLGTGWCYSLYEKEEFFKKICLEWNSFYKEYLKNDAQQNINQWQKAIFKSVSMDNLRWDRGAGYPVLWPGKDNSENFINTYSFDDQVDHLRNWIEARRKFLDECWGTAD